MCTIYQLRLYLHELGRGEVRGTVRGINARRSVSAQRECARNNGQLAHQVSL